MIIRMIVAGGINTAPIATLSTNAATSKIKLSRKGFFIPISNAEVQSPAKCARVY